MQELSFPLMLFLARTANALADVLSRQDWSLPKDGFQRLVDEQLESLRKHNNDVEGAIIEALTGLRPADGGGERLYMAVLEAFCCYYDELDVLRKSLRFLKKEDFWIESLLSDDSDYNKKAAAFAEASRIKFNLLGINPDWVIFEGRMLILNKNAKTINCRLLPVKRVDYLSLLNCLRLSEVIIGPAVEYSGDILRLYIERGVGFDITDASVVFKYDFWKDAPDVYYVLSHFPDFDASDITIRDGKVFVGPEATYKDDFPRLLTERDAFIDARDASKDFKSELLKGVMSLSPAGDYVRRVILD